MKIRCARAKRVTRLQKRLWVRERDADTTLIGGWERALFREVVDLFPLFFVRQRNRVHRVYRETWFTTSIVCGRLSDSISRSYVKRVSWLEFTFVRSRKVYSISRIYWTEFEITLKTHPGNAVTKFLLKIYKCPQDYNFK